MLSDWLGSDVAVRVGVKGRLGEHHVHRTGRSRRRHAGRSSHIFVFMIIFIHRYVKTSSKYEKKKKET